MSVINLSKVDIFGNETGTINTANCYIVHEPGYYSIPLVYGNAIKDGKPNTEAYTNQKPGNYLLFTDYVDYRNTPIQSPEIKTKVNKIGVLWKSDGIEIKNFKLSDQEFSFKLTKKSKGVGENALIAIYDENDLIIWSWHIWYYEGDLNPIYFGDHPRKKTTKNYQFAILPVNLGWNGEIGTFYQWGRKDPFRGDIEKVSVLKREEIFRSIREPEYMYENLNYEGCVNLWDARCENIEDKDNQNPNKSRRTIKTIYDPCPAGFKVPGCDLFQRLRISSVVGKWDNGLQFKGGRSCSPTGVFIPASGYRGRTSGGLHDARNIGYYWSSASYSFAGAYALYFSSRYLNPVYSSYRDCGFSVRPFLE